MADNIAAIHAFTAGMDFAAFQADRKTVYAVVRALEIISEASRRLPTEITAKYSNIDWPAIASVGNLYRHEYENVDDRLLWQSVQHDLEPLNVIAETELSRLL